jgi:DNA-binding NarL/FixJ family response regulator
MAPGIDRVVFATDRPLLLAGFREVLRRVGINCEPGVIEPARLVESVESSERCLVFLDGEGMPSWENLEMARLRTPKSRFVVCCGVIRPELVLAAMERGLDGLLSTRVPVPEAADALTQICRGERQFRFQDTLLPRTPSKPSLSPRERVVLAMVAEGMRNRDIAAALSTSENSVKVHINRLLRKTGTKRRQELAVIATPILTQTHDEPELTSFDGGWMFGETPV